MLDPKTKERIIAEETARFMDEQFGQLDLSGSPDLQHPPVETFTLQDGHGFNRVDDSGLSGINHLKELLANPPRDVVEELAKETRNPALVKELANERAAEIAREFCRRNPDYLKCDANWRSIVETLAHNFLSADDLDADEAQDLLIDGGYWTVENLTRAFKALDRAGALEYPSNHPRPLKEAQRVRIQQLAANGDVLGAITQYVEGRLGEDAGYQAAFVLDDPVALTTDPQIRPVLEEAVFYCWECARHNYSPTPARRRFLREYCAGRFVTLALLDAAWEACKESEKSAARSALLTQVERRPSQRVDESAIDELDDASVSDLFHRTMREHARTTKRRSGVLV
jgi:hypothetical protein